MESYNLSRARLRYIVPFQFNIDKYSYEEVCAIVDSHEDYPYSYLGIRNESSQARWERVSLRQGEQDLYGHVIDEFSQTGYVDYSEKIEKTGLFWSYKTSGGSYLDLRYSGRRVPAGTAEPIDVSIVDMGLYVFRSGVGLLWYEVSYDSQKLDSVDRLIEFQNEFKELNRGISSPLWIHRDKVAAPEEFGDDEWIPFTLGNWIAERLEFLEVSFQAERVNSYASALSNKYCGGLSREEQFDMREELKCKLPETCPDKALLFTYAAFEGEDNGTLGEQALKTAFYLTNGYKESYKMSEDVRHIVRRPFSNVLWMTSREGCGYYAWYDNTNKTFFTRNLYSKIMNDYFLLYIRSIYQSYSLMRYAVYTSEVLPNDYETYLEVSEGTEALAEKISGISAEISLFLVKSMATSVSHIQHQNDFYGYLNERLQIKDEVASVTSGLAALNELQKETAEKKQAAADRVRQEELEIQDQREKDADNTFQIGLGLMTFLVVISAITDAYGIMDSLANDTLPAPWMMGFKVICVICAVILVASIVIFIKSANSLRNRKRPSRSKE